MRRILRFAILCTAVASTIAGAILSALPALVLGIVMLFYNSAGGVLIVLGSLISLLPHPAIPASTAGRLPVFQELPADTGMVLIRSVAATTLCSVAVVALLALNRLSDWKRWASCGLCACLAALIGGLDVALALAPLVLISGGYLAGSWIGHVAHE